jgi:succinate dehydrogenase flavin-adding protein (antitoxin of CptAB toxin-antitoxin module)
MTVEGYRRHRSLPFLLKEYDRRCVILAPVYEELFEQLGRSLWRLMFDTERSDEEEAAELLDVIRKWEARVQQKPA